MADAEVAGPDQPMNLVGMHINTDDLAAAIDNFARAFVWTASPQGYAYWLEVHANLEAILKAARERSADTGSVASRQ